MPLKFQCQCGTKLVVSSRYAGRRVKCPKCSKPIEVPRVEVSSVDEASPTAGSNGPPVAPQASAMTSRSAKESRSRSSSRPKTPRPPVMARDTAPASSTVNVKPPPLQTESPELLSRDVAEAEPPPVQRQTEPETPTQPTPTPPCVGGQAGRDPDALKGGDPPVVKPSPPIGRSKKAAPASEDTASEDTKKKSPIVIPPALETRQEAKRPAAAKQRSEHKPAATDCSPSPPPLPASNKSDDAIRAALLPGYQPTEDQVAIVRAIGISLAAVAAISAIPAIMDIIDHMRAEASLGVARWAYLVLMLAALQGAYSAYVYQLPDWSTVWVVTIVTLVIATGYAMMLGLTFITHGDAWLVRILDLGDVFRGGRDSLWCFVMLCLTSLISYFSGRISVRWRGELIAT